MRKYSRLFLTLHLLTIGLYSCEKNDIDESPEFNISIENASFDSLYNFASEYKALNDYVIVWSINGKKIADLNLDKNSKNNLSYRLEEGLNMVCFMASKEDRFVEECVEIDTTKNKIPCPNLFYEAEKDKLQEGVYNFHSLFRNVSKTSYRWTINGVVVDTEIVNHRISKDDYLKYKFVSGIHEVCMITVSELCEEIIFCTEIHIK